jgi:hypothetical protein
MGTHPEGDGGAVLGTRVGKKPSLLKGKSGKFPGRALGNWELGDMWGQPRGCTV